MSRQQRGGGSGEVARGAGYAALLGALLIGVAVVIGIVLLQIGDSNDNGPASTAGTKTDDHDEATPRPPRRRSRTTRPRRRRRRARPAQVQLIVLNGGAASGPGRRHDRRAQAARATRTSGEANDWTGHTQTGQHRVLPRRARPGRRRARDRGRSRARSSKIPYPTPPPPFSAGQRLRRRRRRP